MTGEHPVDRRSRVGGWLPAMRLYLVLNLAWHLLWEVLQLPLYTIWQTGTPAELAFAVLHCTVGDLLIALSCLLGAVLVAGSPDWPHGSFARVAAIALAAGVAYTGFSEWLNVEVRKAWAYSEWMPIVPILGARIGLSPLLQWLVVPVAAFAVTHGWTVAVRTA